MSDRASEINKLVAEHHREKIMVDVVTMKMGAAKQTHDAHVFAGESKEADTVRQQMHALLDIQLDHSNRMLQLYRELVEVPPDPVGES